MTMTDAGLGNRIKVSSPKRVWVGSWVGAWVGSWVGAARILAGTLACLLTYLLTTTRSGFPDHLITTTARSLNVICSLTSSPSRHPGDRARMRPARRGQDEALRDDPRPRRVRGSGLP